MQNLFTQVFSIYLLDKSNTCAIFNFLVYCITSYKHCHLSGLQNTIFIPFFIKVYAQFIYQYLYFYKSFFSFLTEFEAAFSRCSVQLGSITELENRVSTILVLTSSMSNSFYRLKIVVRRPHKNHQKTCLIPVYRRFYILHIFSVFLNQQSRQPTAIQ